MPYQNPVALRRVFLSYHNPHCDFATCTACASTAPSYVAFPFVSLSIALFAMLNPTFAWSAEITLMLVPW